jgi:nucleoside-diphosphate-sugar epimerase
VSESAGERPAARPGAGIGDGTEAPAGGGRLAYLTGATGFIGGRVAARLKERGYRLRCLVRTSSRTAALERLGAELRVGELTDPADHATGLAGADVAFHIAGIYDVGVVDEPALERANVLGTRAFLAALAEAATPRAVYVSSTVALGPAPAAEQGSATPEEQAYRSGYPTAYHRTKAQAHLDARAAQRAGAPLVIVCPAYVYGPGDEGPAGRFLRDLVRRRVPGLLAEPATFSFVHVDDVADGLVRAGEAGRPGAVYVLSGEALTINEFAERAMRVLGRRAPRLRFPVPLARATGVLLDPISRLTGVRFPISRESVAAAARDRWVHGGETTVRELGWEPRPLEQGLPETVAAVAAER